MQGREDARACGQYASADSPAHPLADASASLPARTLHDIGPKLRQHLWGKCHAVSHRRDQMTHTHNVITGGTGIEAMGEGGCPMEHAIRHPSRRRRNIW